MIKTEWENQEVRENYLRIEKTYQNDTLMVKTQRVAKMNGKNPV